MTEVWKDIDGYEYQVSNKGNIRSLDRHIEHIDSRKGTLVTRFQRGVVLKQSIGTSGYPTAHLHCTEKGRRTVMVHRLVALAFVEPVDGKEFVNHKDGDKTNNNYDNLEWVTKSENTLHALDNGLLKKRGEDSNFAKLTEQDVTEILSLRKYGKRKYFARDIAPIYGVSTEYVTMLGNNPTYWAALKSTLTDEVLYETFLEVTKTLEPSKPTHTPSKHNFTDEEAEDIIRRRKAGDRVVDIARDYGKSQRVISWFTLKHIRGEGT